MHIPHHSALHLSDEDHPSRLLQPAVKESTHVVQAVVVLRGAELQDLHHSRNNRRYMMKRDCGGGF